MVKTAIVAWVPVDPGRQSSLPGSKMWFFDPQGSSPDEKVLVDSRFSARVQERWFSLRRPEMGVASSSIVFSFVMTHPNAADVHSHGTTMAKSARSEDSSVCASAEFPRKRAKIARIPS